MESRPPPAAPGQAPTTWQKVPGPQSPSLTGQGPRAQASTAPARPHRGHRQPPQPQPTGRHILQGCDNRPPGAADGTGPGVGSPLPRLPGTRPTTQRPPETTPPYTPDQKAYKCYWHKGTPLYAGTGIHVHLVPHLGIPGRLGVYEVVGDGWQLNVINAHVPFSDATEPFLQALAGAYRQMALLAPTIIIGDMNAAPTPGEPRGTGHTPGPGSPQHHGHAGARGPDCQPRRQTIPLRPPNRGCPLPHRCMLWRPHHHHPGRGPIWTPPAGTHRTCPPAHPPHHPQPSPQPPRGCRPRPTTPPEDAPNARQTGLVPISQGHRPRPAHPTGPHRPTHSHAQGRRRLRLPAAPPG